MASYWLTRRGFRLLGILLLSFVGWIIYLSWYDSPSRSSEPSPPSPPLTGPQLPPLYEEVREKENSLPHYKDYEHKTVKYFLAANHFHSSGWGNVMQDYVMMGLLAHATNRSFVFNDYVWNTNGSLYSDYNGKLIPSRTPLSALLGGPMVGGPWPPGDQTPLSVSREFFHKVCRNPTVLQTSEINTDEVRFNDDVPASYLFEKWVEKINSIDDSCIMLDPNSHPIFEYWIFGNKRRMLSIWPHVSKSPVATHWEWSSIVHDAFRRNHLLFEPPIPFGWLGWHSGSQKKTLSIPGLLAIHVRRGDFEDHCVHLSKWNADWHAFNSFPEFRDKFDVPASSSSYGNIELYVPRCYPSIERIVEKVYQVRAEAENPLRYVYIMTNGPKPWVEELKFALAESMHWDHISSSRDLNMTWEQQFVAQSLDMHVAQRAQVFIGNGIKVVKLDVQRGYATHGPKI